MEFKNRNVLLFDLDGTLTDPKEGITTCVQVALERCGVTVEDRDVLCPFIGPPLKEAFMAFYGFDSEKADEAVKAYRERFATVGKFENKVYDGMEGFLQNLCSHGKRLMVATSKPEIFAKEILEHFGLARYFSFIGGALLDDSRVLKEDVVAYVLKENGVSSQEAVMIGDREHDVFGAHKNGVPCIGVLYGYGGREELLHAGAEAVAATLDELTDLLIG